MLSKESLKEFTKKNQTIEKNIAREYIQHLFLSFLLPVSHHLVLKDFKGNLLREIDKNI